MIRFDKRAIHVPGGPASASLRGAVPLATQHSSKGKVPWWECPLPDAAKVVKWADQANVPVDPAVRHYASTLWMAELDAMGLSSATALEDGQACPEVEGLTSTLLSTQEVVILAATRAVVKPPRVGKKGRALIVADEPGLGKTLIALAALQTKGFISERSLIICPTSLTENWQAEMAQHFELGTFFPWTARTTTPHAIPDETNIVVIGWDILYAWADMLIKWKPTAVVADEAHYAKSGKQQFKEKDVVAKGDDGKVIKDDQGNAKVVKEQKVVAGSARASAVLKVGTAVAKSGGLVVALTGTPIVNRPLELEPLLEFVDIVHLVGGGTAFRNRFCDPKRKNVGRSRPVIDYSGASNLLELNARLTASGHYIRRTKESLVDSGFLQPKYVDGVYCYDHHTRPNPWIITATSQEMQNYLLAENDLGEFFAQQAREFAQQFGYGVSTQRVQAKVVAQAARHLQRITALRQLAAQVKMKYVVAKVNELVAQGERVVIAAHHRDIVDTYADAFSGLKITGSMSVREVEKAKMLFNSTPLDEHPVMALSIEAGKTGHTLCKQAINGVGQACRFMVLAEQIWTPGDEAQVQDRIWRIGQDREVRIVNALLANSIDGAIYGQRCRKRAVVNTAVDAVDLGAKGDEREGAGLLAWSLASARLTPGRP